MPSAASGAPERAAADRHEGERQVVADGGGGEGVEQLLPALRALATSRVQQEPAPDAVAGAEAVGVVRRRHLDAAADLGVRGEVRDEPVREPVWNSRPATPPKTGRNTSSAAYGSSCRQVHSTLRAGATCEQVAVTQEG